MDSSNLQLKYPELQQFKQSTKRQIKEQEAQSFIDYIHQLDNKNEGQQLALGRDVKSSSPEDQKSKDIRQEYRHARYSLQQKIAGIYIKEGKKLGLKYAANFHATAKCKRCVIKKTSVGVWKTGNRGYFSGLITCGNVWTCPMCANREQEVRREEIALAMKHFYKSGNKKAVMVTLTFPHNISQPLKELLDRQSQALKSFRSGKQWQTQKEEIGFEGLIRALELTYGRNGWHPHTHELWFIDRKADAKQLKIAIQERWKKSCIKAGLIQKTIEDKELKDFFKHSVDIIDNCTTSEYLAKAAGNAENWGIDKEMARASTKKGKLSGLTPFDLVNEGKTKLWLEFTEAIRGKAQLYFSPGIKELIEVLVEVEKEDDEEKPVFICWLQKQDWQDICTTDKRAFILNLAEEEENPEDKIETALIEIRKQAQEKRQKYYDPDFDVLIIGCEEKLAA